MCIRDRDTLAAAYAEGGDFSNAIRLQLDAIAKCTSAHKAKLESHLATFKKGHAVRSPIYREWVDSKGNSAIGLLVSMTSDSASISNGSKTLKVPYRYFSREDRTFLNKLAKLPLDFHNLSKSSERSRK